MTFSFTAAGTKDQVLEQVDAAVAQHVRYNNPAAEIEQVVGVVKHYLDVGAFPTGLYVETAGHLGDYGGSLQLTIRPLNIPQPPALPAEPVTETAPEPAAEPTTPAAS